MLQNNFSIMLYISASAAEPSCSKIVLLSIEYTSIKPFMLLRLCILPLLLHLDPNLPTQTTIFSRTNPDSRQIGFMHLHSSFFDLLTLLFLLVQTLLFSQIFSMTSKAINALQNLWDLNLSCIFQFSTVLLAEDTLTLYQGVVPLLPATLFP